MAEEVDALSGAKFSSGLYLKDIPKDGVKIRVLTRDPMVYVDKFGNTKYVFAVYNIDDDMVQILDKGPGFASEFQKINADTDFGADIRKIDLKLSSNGKSGKDIRYDIKPVGAPHELDGEAIKTIYSQGFNLAEKVQKNAPNALRLSEVNAGKKVRPDSVEPSDTVNGEDVVIEDIPDEINLDDIPF